MRASYKDGHKPPEISIAYSFDERLPKRHFINHTFPVHLVPVVSENLYVANYLETTYLHGV